MSGVLGGGSNTSTVNNVTQIPPEIQGFATQNLQDAQTASVNLARPFDGNMIPGLDNPYTQQSWNMIGQGMPNTGGAYDEGMNMARTAGDYTPTMINAQQMGTPQMDGSRNTVGARGFLQGDVGAYMNPFIGNVENRALENMDRSRQLAINGVGDQAITAGAGWGSRQGIREGVTNSESVRAMGDLSANLRSQAFDRAGTLINADNDRFLTADRANQQTQFGYDSANQQAELTARRANQDADLRAQTSNQEAGLTGAKQQLLAGAQFGDMARLRQNSFLQGASALEGIGQQQRAYEGQLLGQQAQNYNDARNFELEKLGIRQSALGQTPYGKTQTATGPSQAGNPLLGGLGGAMAGASLASTLGATAGSSGSLLGAGGGALLGLLSDEREKTDIEKVGPGPDGVDLYAFRYKGDPKNYPKVVGPMAQGVEKADPSAVTEIGGKKVITGGNLGFGSGGRSDPYAAYNPVPNTPGHHSPLSAGLQRARSSPSFVDTVRSVFGGR